jgi:hypothetical protein
LRIRFEKIWTLSIAKRFLSCILHCRLLLLAMFTRKTEILAPPASYPRKERPSTLIRKSSGLTKIPRMRTRTTPSLQRPQSSGYSYPRTSFSTAGTQSCASSPSGPRSAEQVLTTRRVCRGATGSTYSFDISGMKEISIAKHKAR